MREKERFNAAITKKNFSGGISVHLSTIRGELTHISKKSMDVLYFKKSCYDTRAFLIMYILRITNHLVMQCMLEKQETYTLQKKMEEV